MFECIVEFTLQYMYSMFSTHHTHLSNGRYPNLTWTTALDYLKSFAGGSRE